LPTKIADRYIRKRNPGFLDEHGSFASINLLTPAEFRRLLRLSQLSLLHALPCCMDYEDLPVLKRVSYRTLGALRLSWHPIQEFWGCLVRTEARRPLRAKCVGHHRIALNERESAAEEFSSMIDFRSEPRAHQLKSGWFPHEKTEQGFRWTTGRAEAWLQSEGGEEFLSIIGYRDESDRGAPVTLSVYFDEQWIGEHPLVRNEKFSLRFLLPYRMRRLQICTILLVIYPCHTPGGSDQRKLGLPINQVGLVPEFGNRLDFSRGPESHKLGSGWFAHERNGLGFRWTTDQAEIWLQADGNESVLFVSGFWNPSERNRPAILSIYVDEHWIGKHRLEPNPEFRLRFQLPYPMRHLQICTIRFVVDPCHTPQGLDRRRLGVAVNEVLIGTLDSKLDFNVGPESQKLGRGWFSHERDERGFRWTSDRAEICLQAAGNERAAFVAGYCNAAQRAEPATLTVYFDDQRIWEHHVERDEIFNLHIPLPHILHSSQICSLVLSVSPCYAPGNDDRRTLGMMIFTVSLY
jgi:hypothetical protein